MIIGLNLPHFYHLCRPAQGPIQSPSQWVAGFFAKSKAVGARFEHLPPSNANFKNEWSCTSTLAICLHGMGRDNLPFYFYAHFSDAEVEKRFSYFVKYSNSLRPGIAGWFSWQLVFSSQQWAKILLFTVTSTLGVWSTEPTSPVAAGWASFSVGKAAKLWN
jgi:hypothetical protein